MMNLQYVGFMAYSYTVIGFLPMCGTKTGLIKSEPDKLKCQIMILLLKSQKIYRVSIKSLYNLKKLSKSEMMRYRNEVCFMLTSIS